MAYNIVFNGVNMPSFVKVKTVDFPVFADLSTFVTPKTGGIGGIFAGSTLGVKKIKVSIMLKPRAIQDTNSMMARELAVWLQGNMWKPSELVFSDDPNILYDAICDNSIDITDLIFAGAGEITFLVPSGVGRGIVHAKLATSVNLTTKTAIMYYNGTAPSSAYITYHPNTTIVPADQWQMTVTETGDRLNMLNFMSSGNNTIDCEKRRITSSTSTSMKDVDLNLTEWINFPKAGMYHLTWNFPSSCTLGICCTEYYL